MKSLTWFSRAADHDIDDNANTQITLYSGRGLYIESTAGTFWLVGTAVEHHTLYQYQLANTKNIFAAQLQTETPYFQPLPNALVPYTAVTSLQDPVFSCTGVSGNCAEAWGLRVLSTSNVLIYGSNHYSWFDNYSQSMYAPFFIAPLEWTASLLSVMSSWNSCLLITRLSDCSTFATGESCQARIVDLEGTNSGLSIYSLNTIGATSMINNGATEVAAWEDNMGVYQSNIISLKG